MFSINLRFPLAITMAVLMSALNFAGAVTEPLLAGAASVDLTPPLEMKVALGGYGERMSKPALGIHDAVRAKALVLEQGGRRFVLVTADILAFPPGFKTLVMDRLAADGWSSDQIMLLPSHSHTSFDMMTLHPGNSFEIPQLGIYRKDVTDHVADALARVIRVAGSNRVAAATASVTTSGEGKNRNRRHGGVIHDEGLTVTRLDGLAGQPVAVLVNWTGHPTFMEPEDMMFSGDWPGHMQRTLEALIGRGVIALFYNGAEGDQSPVPPADCHSNWERAERYGREMGILAWQTWNKIQPRHAVDLKFHTETITLPERVAHPDFMKTGGAEYGLNEGMMKGFLSRLVPEKSHSTSLRLGNLVILGVPGEMAAELGLELKSRCRELTGLPCVTIGGLADEWVSYMLPAGEYRKGGYEASVSFYGETLGTTVVEGVTRGMRGLK